MFYKGDSTPKFRARQQQFEATNMDGFYITYNESASGVTAPRTVFETRQRDTRAMVAAVEEGDGVRWE